MSALQLPDAAQNGKAGPECWRTILGVFALPALQGNAEHLVQSVMGTNTDAPLRMLFSEVLEVKTEALGGDFNGDGFATQTLVIWRCNPV